MRARSCAAVRAVICAAGLVVTQVGCESPAADPAAGRAGDLEAGLRAVNRALGLSTGFVAVGVVDPGATAQNIAVAIHNRVTSELGGCGTTAASGTTVNVDLAGGCTFQTASIDAAGTLAVEVIQTARDVTVRLTPLITVDGQMLSGRFDAVTENGGTYFYAADLALQGVRADLPNVRAGIGGGQGALTASGTITGKSGGFTVSTTSVEQVFDACYPHGGTARLTGAGLDETWTFLADTPRTGVVTLAPARVVLLPTRPGCPR